MKLYCICGTRCHPTELAQHQQRCTRSLKAAYRLAPVIVDRVRAR